MGAGNVAAAFQLWAGRVPATSMQVLLYMALVSKDADPRPWFSQGREALAIHALGRPAPFTQADARAVERAIEPLLAVEAIETERRASVRRTGSSTARYRLNLSPTDAPRKTWGVEKVHAPRKTSAVNPAGDPQRPTETVHDAPRKPSARPTETVRTPHGNRGAEEKEDFSRSEREEEGVEVTPTSHPPRATANDDEPAPVIPLFPKARTEPVPLPAPAFTRRDRIADALAESAARVAARRAEHQAQLAAGGEP